MTASIAYRKLPGFPDLFLDAVDGKPAALQLVGSSSLWRATSVLPRSAGRSGIVPRAELACVMEQFNREIGAPAPALRNARDLALPGSVAVVTGQQAGLLGGPGYTLHKALSAVEHAAAIERATPGVRAIPVFWIEDDDDDLAEATTAGAFSADGDPVTVGPLGPVARTPVGRVPVDGQIMAMVRRTLDLFPRGAGFEGVRTAVENAYREGVPLSVAFASLLTALVGDRGLVMLRAQDATFKRLCAPALEDLVSRNEAFRRGLLEGVSRFESASYKIQVPIRSERACLFHVGANGRTPILVRGAEFEAEGLGRLSEKDLRTLVRANPEAFTTDVLSRPILQDMVLPTAAYVAGPHEIAYHAQIRPAYGALSVPAPALVPRASLTILEPETEALLTRHGFDPGRLIAAGMRPERVAAELPDGARLETQFASARAEAAARLDRLGLEALALDPALERALAKIRRKTDYQISRLGRLTLRALAGKEEVALRRARLLTRRLLPWGELQERRIAFCHFLAAGGPDAPARLGTAAGLEASVHRIVRLG